MQEELHGGPDVERVRELSERLAEVSSTVGLLAVAQGSGAVGSPGPVAKLDSASGERTRDEPDALGGSGVDVAAAITGTAQAGSPAVSSPPGAVGSNEPPVERRKSPAPSRPESSSPAALQSIPTSVGEYTFTKLVDEQEQTATQQPLASVEPIQPEIEIRDVRREEGPSAWVSSVGRLLARHAEDGLPFAVLLVEIVDVARLERSETPHDLHGLVAQVESALGRGMRATDRLSRETLGRYWLVAPETNGTGAQNARGALGATGAHLRHASQRPDGGRDRHRRLSRRRHRGARSGRARRSRRLLRAGHGTLDRPHRSAHGELRATETDRAV